MNAKNSGANPGATAGTAEPSPSATAESRRRFIRGGLSVAVPTVLTLSSRSVLACHCKSPSAQGSLSGSQMARNGTNFSSTPPKTYATWMNQDRLPGGVTKTTQLQVLFPWFKGQAAGSLPIKSKSLTQFQKDLVAAYLNIKYIPILSATCLTIRQLQSMASGSYSPATGVYWGTGEIQNYLRANYLLAP